MKILSLFILANLLAIIVNAQNGKTGKFFITTGYGIAGSFFVRSYDEFAPVSNYKVFEKKKFIGNAQNFSIGYKLKNNWYVQLGINFQHFTRHINSRDTLGNVLLINDHTIHHRDYMWFGSFGKSFPVKKHLFIPAFGIYYLRPKQQEVEIYPAYFANIERDYHNSRLEEGGAFIEFAYEYKFQPKVNLGIKSQFYYTISTGEPESVTLFPYIKINF